MVSFLTSQFSTRSTTRAAILPSNTLYLMNQSWLIIQGWHVCDFSNVNPGFINPKRLFNWEGTIEVSDYDYWRSNPPNFHRPWFINPGLTLCQVLLGALFLWFHLTKSPVWCWKYMEILVHTGYHYHLGWTYYRRIDNIRGEQLPHATNGETHVSGFVDQQIWLVVWRFFMTFHWVGNNTIYCTSQLTFSIFQSICQRGRLKPPEMDQCLNQHVGMLVWDGMVCFHSQDDLFRLLVQDSENFSGKPSQESNMTMEHHGTSTIYSTEIWLLSHWWFPHGNYLGLQPCFDGSFRGSSLEAGGPLFTV